MQQTVQEIRSTYSVSQIRAENVEWFHSKDQGAGMPHSRQGIREGGDPILSISCFSSSVPSPQSFLTFHGIFRFSFTNFTHAYMEAPSIRSPAFKVKRSNQIVCLRLIKCMSHWRREIDLMDGCVHVHVCLSQKQKEMKRVHEDRKESRSREG